MYSSDYLIYFVSARVAGRFSEENCIVKPMKHGEKCHRIRKKILTVRGSFFSPFEGRKVSLLGQLFLTLAPQSAHFSGFFSL